MSKTPGNNFLDDFKEKMNIGPEMLSLSDGPLKLKRKIKKFYDYFS